MAHGNLLVDMQANSALG